MKYKSNARIIRRRKAARRRRRAAALMLAMCAAAAAGFGMLTTALANDTGRVYETVIVAGGDTLWDIAREHNFANRDIRTVVDKIMRENGMTTTRICAGDKIRVPVN